MNPSYTSSQSTNFRNNSIFLNNQINMFRSPYNKILHDPECESQCCSGSFVQPKLANNFNNLEQYSKFTVYNLDESIPASNKSENQFLCYNISTSKSQVPEFQEDVRHELLMKHSELDCENPLKRTRYGSCSTSISVNSAEERFKQKSYCKGITKRKRKRTVFSTEQIIVMEGVFKKRPYVSKEERLFLSKKLNITERAIKIWFQNRRRVTEKRDRDQSDSYHSDSTVEEVSNDYNTRLDYIESQIRQNTNEYGFVTLDAKSLTELVMIIDNVLSTSVDCHEIKSNDSYIMYEPVSPESLSDDNKDSENISKWEPSKPEESLQRLIDIHTVFYS